MFVRLSTKTSVFLLLLCLALSAVFVKCTKYSKDSRGNGGSCDGGFCEAKDEYDEPCLDDGKKGDHGSTDDDEPSLEDDDEPSLEDDNEQPEEEFEEFDYPKEGLFRWDPVKVRCEQSSVALKECILRR